MFFFMFVSTKIRTIPLKSRWLAGMHLGDNEEISEDNANRNCLVHVQMLEYLGIKQLKVHQIDPMQK